MKVYRERDRERERETMIIMIMMREIHIGCKWSIDRSCSDLQTVVVRATGPLNMLCASAFPHFHVYVSIFVCVPMSFEAYSRTIPSWPQFLVSLRGKAPSPRRGVPFTALWCSSHGTTEPTGSVFHSRFLGKHEVRRTFTLSTVLHVYNVLVDVA